MTYFIKIKVLLVLTVLVCSTAAMAGSASMIDSLTDQLNPNIRSYRIPTDLIRPYKVGLDRVGLDGREVIVATPSGYNDPVNQNQSYPVIYLLHGAPGNPWNFIHLGMWPKTTQKMALENEIIPPILVMPDGNYASEKHGDCEWLNSADGRDKFMDFVCKDVVSWTDAHFRTITQASGRIIGGVSEGAYGAVNIAMQHPEIFGNVLALSGYYTNDGSGWARPIMGSDPKFILENSPIECVQADDKSLPAGWTQVRFFLGSGDNESRYTTETKTFFSLLQAKGVDVHLQILKGKHGWALWNQLYADGTRILLAKNPQKAPITEVAHVQGTVAP